MSHYETLGVAESASPEELKAAFRKLAKQHHPDVGGDQTKFQQINEAYSTLSEPNSRAHYDHTLRNPQPHFHQHHQAHRQAGNPFEFHFNFGGGPDPMSAFHDQFFNQFGFHVRQPQINRNIRLTIELDLIETLTNQVKVLEYRTSTKTETIQFEIPAGIENGMTFTISGRGDDLNPQLPRGNLEVNVKIKPNSRYFRNNENIIEDITIDCFKAITGTTLPITLPSGKNIDLNIPPGIQNASQFGITDEGFPRGNNCRGKYIARINILIPTALTSDQINLVKEIQKIKPINT